MSIRMGAVLALLVLTACGRRTLVDEPDSGGSPDASMPGEALGCVWASERSDGGSEWAYQLGTSRSEEFLDVVGGAPGTLLLAGYVNGDVGVDRVDPSGDSAGLLMRLESMDPPARLRHSEKYFDLPGSTETLDALTLHPVTGEPFFAGRTTGAFDRAHGASVDYINQGQQDVFVGGPRGSEQEAILYQGGTARPQHPNRLAFDAQGHLVVSGFDDIYVPTNYVERWEDPFVTQLQRSADGATWSEAWTRSFDTEVTDVLTGLAVDPHGDLGIYVTGNVSTGTQRGAFVYKLDNATGQRSGAWRQSSIGFDIVQAAHFREDGNLLIAGTTFGVLGERSYGEQDVFLRLLNMDPARGAVGAPLWTKQYGSPASDYLTDMAVDGQGRIVVVGETLGSVLAEDPSAYQGNYDLFMMKFDENGERIDVRQWGSAGDDHPNAVTVDPSGRVFIAGYTTGSLLPTCAAAGQRDALLLSLP